MKESNINRIFARSAEEKNEWRASLEKNYVLQNKAALEFKNERIKTPEQIEIIEFLDRETNKIAEEFNGEALNVPPKNIHIINTAEFAAYLRKADPKLEKVPDALIVKEGDARFSINLQGIVTAHGDLDLFAITRILAHEMFHCKSFQSLRIDVDLEKRPRAISRRAGLAITKRADFKKNMLTDLNEAITEYLVRRMMEGLSANRSLLPDALKERTRDLNKEEFVDSLYRPSYTLEQIRLVTIMDEIINKHPNEFKTREDVLRVFGEAYFKGGLIKLSKLIDKTFGKGSFISFAKEGLPPSTHDKSKKTGIK